MNELVDAWRDGVDHVDPTHLLEVLGHLAVAIALSSLLAYRPWRRLMKRSPAPRPEIAQAQVLIATAGAIVIVVIGDSLGRAFSLVGLGAFIRFRAGIKDPRDAATMFLMIGVGMACGLANIPLAVLATVVAGILLFALDVMRRRPRRTRVAIRAVDPRAALPGIRAAFPGGRVLEAPTAVIEKSRILIEMDLGYDDDAARILAVLEERGVQGIQDVALEEE